MATIPKGRPINPSIWPHFTSTQLLQTAEGTRLAGASYDWQGPADPFGVGQAENATPLPSTLRAGVADAIQHLRDRAGGILAFASRNSRKNVSKVFPVSVDGVMLDPPHLAQARRLWSRLDRASRPDIMGPLEGVRIVEFAGLGPAPFGAMLLADLGADIIRLDRPGGYPAPHESLSFEEFGKFAFYNRNRRTVRLDLKAGGGREPALRLIRHADALIEPFRPGVMEKLGLGPAECLAANPRLLYARMTGWGQTGPLARTAGHDLNYIGLSGALGLFNPDPEHVPGIPPLIGDMGGGGLFMAFGLLAGIISAKNTGKGQVMDAAIVDGSAALYATIKSLHKAGAWPNPAGRNTIDGGRYFYRVYRCSDRGLVSVGAIEPAFRKVLLDRLGLANDPAFANDDEAMEAERRAKVARVFAQKTRDEWAALFAATDGCVAPVLSMDEAETHPQALARGSFTEVDGVSQPTPAPRFSATPPEIAISPQEASRSDPQALAGWGFSADEIDALRAGGIVS